MRCPFTDLMQKVLNRAKDSTAEPNIGASHTARQRKPAKSPTRKEEPKRPAYTSEQLEQVKRIKK